MLVYDGHCSFCSASAEWLRFATPDRVRLVPYQGADLASLGLTPEQATGAAHWIDPDGRRWTGARCFARALVVRGGGWRLAGWVLLTPPFSWGARLAYALVLRVRHRLGPP